MNIGDKEELINNVTTEIGHALATAHKVDTSDEASPRAVSEVKIGLRLFENKDIFFRILHEGGSLKNFRLVCSVAAKLIIDFWLWNRNCLVKLYPVNLTPGNALLSKSETEFKINQYKFKFITKNPFQFKLSLSCKLDLQAFHTLLCSNEMNDPAFIQKAQRITTLAVAYLNEGEVKILKEILKEINKHPNAFINLRSLQTIQLADLTDFSIPNSIEHFESCINRISLYHNAKICNLPNLKSIALSSLKLCAIGDFKIQNLQNLQSLMFGGPPLCDININRKECPNLKSIILDNEEMFFDKSVEIITIQGSNLLTLDTHLQLPADLPNL